MKKTILVVASIVAFNYSYAQEGKPSPQESKKEGHQHPPNGAQSKKMKTPEERAKFQAEKMEKLLNLTAEQKTKVHDAALKKYTKIKTAKENHKADTDKKVLGQEIKNAREEYRSELNTILTPEQKDKLKQHHDEIKAKHDAKKAEMKAKHDAQQKGKPEKPKEKPTITQPDDIDIDADELEEAE